MTPDNTPTPQAGETKLIERLHYEARRDKPYRNHIDLCHLFSEAATAILTLQSQVKELETNLMVSRATVRRAMERAEKVEKERDEWSRKHSDAVWSLNQILEAAEAELEEVQNECLKQARLAETADYALQEALERAEARENQLLATRKMKNIQWRRAIDAEREVVELRAALEPFANASRIELEGAVRKVYVSVADLRRARAALDKGGE